MPRCPIPTTELTGTDVSPYTMTPTGQRVLLRLIPLTGTTQGGIHLSAESSDAPEAGTVVSVGRRVKGIQPGTHVQFARHCPGEEFTKGDERFKLVPVDDLVGSIEV